jgi:hypothetical protein
MCPFLIGGNIYKKNSRRECDMLMWMDCKYFHTCYKSVVENILNLATEENALGFLRIVIKFFRFSANCNKII